MPNEQVVYDIATNAVTVALASGGVAAGFGKWVLAKVKEVRDDIGKRLDNVETFLSTVNGRLERINGAVGENTRWRLAWQDGVEDRAAAMANLTAQVTMVNKQITEVLVPLANLAQHLRAKE